MKYSAKVTLAPLVVLLVGGSLTAHVTMRSGNQQPVRQPVQSGNILNRVKTAPMQNFSGMDGMKVAYPPMWSATLGATNDTNKAQQSVDFKAPNTFVRTTSEGEEKIVSGAKITLIKNNTAKSKTLDEYKQSDSFIWKYAENKKDGTVKDMPVVEFDSSYEGDTQHYAVFYKDGREYILAMDGETHKKEEFKAIFESMIKNMEFKQSP